MALNNITNTDLINLVNCESEPIQIPGSIQPQGCLLVIDAATQIVTFCSANIADYIMRSPEEILGRTLASFLPEPEVENFNNYIKQYVANVSNPHVFNIAGTEFNTIVHKSDKQIQLELEPFPDGNLSLPDLYKQTRNFISFIESANYLQDLCQSVAEQTRNITGYDRVMVYRFDKDYNGEVFAESRREDLVSYMEHRYPHTDIPAQARELYMRNLLRIIVDVNYEPVPILTIEKDADHTSVDLSDSILRSVSPIHIEYLRNMGVAATLTISLIHKGKLWGLIACHHYSAKNLPHYTRLAARMQGHFLTSQISVREVKEEFDVAGQSEFHLNELQKDLLHQQQFSRVTNDNPHLLAIANATGVVIVNDSVFYKNGEVPDDAALSALIEWLANYTEYGYLATDHLADIYANGIEIARVASGIIYHSFGKKSTDCIIWFRPEVIQTIDWAGYPNKVVLEGETGKRLTPRKSFNLWREFVKYKSVAWKKPEINACASFAYSLQKQMLYQYLSREEERYRKLSEKLQETNEELANINWISTHDLKEPLRKIQIFGSRILETEKDSLSGAVTNSIERMRSAANRMQHLLDDILAYSHINNKEQAFTEVSLNVVFLEITSDLREEIAAKSATLIYNDLPTIHGIGFQLKQLFVNLTANALKFAKETELLVIKIKSTTLNDINENGIVAIGKYYRISFEDNGIGFDDVYASRIFDVFQRLHTNHKYSGTGIGLSICRKIMANHDGYMVAGGQVNVGAVFTMYFPA